MEWDWGGFLLLAWMIPGGLARLIIWRWEITTQGGGFMSRRPDHPGSSKHPKKLEPSQPSLVGYCNSFIPKLREDEQVLRKREVEDTTRHFDYFQYVNRRFTRIFQLVTFLRSVSASDRWARMRRLGWMVGILQWVGEVLKCCWGDDLQLQRERYRFQWFPKVPSVKLTWNHRK